MRKNNKTKNVLLLTKFVKIFIDASKEKYAKTSFF